MKKKCVIAVFITIVLLSTTISSSSVPNSKELIPQHQSKLYRAIPIQNSPQETIFQDSIRITQIPYIVKVLFDESHNQYYNSYRLSAFLDDIQRYYNAVVDIHSSGAINSSLLAGYDILILPNPRSPLTADEINAIKDFINAGGSLLIMGDYYEYFEPTYYVENITRDYGIGWYDAELIDLTNNDFLNYSVIIHTWKNNSVANFVSNDGIFEVEAYSSTALYWTGVNSSAINVYIVGTGDDDTIVHFDNDTEKTLGYDAIAFMAADVLNGGRIFASGSSGMFRSDAPHYYLDNEWNTSAFAMLMFEWLMGRGLAIVKSEVPSTLLLNQHGLINITVTNNWKIGATNVKIGIEIEGALDLLNASNIYTIDTLPAGSSISLTWEVVATGNSLANVTIKVWSDNVPGFSKIFRIQTLSLTVTLTPTPKEFLIYERNNFTLFVEVYNPTTIAAEDITLNLILPKELSTLNATTYSISVLNPGETEDLNYIIMVNDIGFFEITVEFTSANLGSGSVSTRVSVYNALIVFDEGHGQFYSSSKMTKFIEYLKQYALVEINTGNFTEELLSRAHLVIIPYPNDGLYDFEIPLLKSYIANGGKLWVMGNYYEYFDPENLNILTSEYGIIWNDGEIMDKVQNYKETPFKPILSVFADNILAKLLSAGVSSVLAQGCTYLNVSSPAVPILLGNPTSYGVNATGDPSGINGTDLIAAAAVELASGGKLFAMGGTLPFAYTENPEYNHRFIDNIIRWLIGPRALNDFEPPEITITTPAEGSYLAAQTVTVKWSVTDATGANVTMIYLDDALLAVLTGGETSYTLTDLAEGSHTVKIVVYDKGYLSSEATVMFTIDITKPTVTIIAPQEGAKLRPGNITVKFNATDNIGIDKIEIYLDGELVATLPGTANETSIAVAPGEHTISVVVYDLAGNQASALVRVIVQAPPPPSWGIIAGGVIVVVIIIGVLLYFYRFKKKA
ncbi:MAG: Ig-like domain-containing protein [Candidatus Njordarchaeales archaeon]